MSRRSSCNGSQIAEAHEYVVNKGTSPNILFSPHQNFKNNAFNLAKILNTELQMESSGGETDRQDLANINKTKMNVRPETLSPSPINQGIHRGQPLLSPHAPNP